MNLADLAKKFRKGILLALSLVIIEHVAWIVEPAVFGQAVDAIIGRVTRDGPAVRTLDVFPLFLWVVVFAVNSGAGVVRRVVDERIYLRIYSGIATQIATEGKLKLWCIKNNCPGADVGAIHLFSSISTSRDHRSSRLDRRRSDRACDVRLAIVRCLPHDRPTTCADYSGLHAEGERAAEGLP
jgi:uncharacterized membrane protein